MRVAAVYVTPVSYTHLNVLNVMSQQSIQLSPDVNVASVLQRVSGDVYKRQQLFRSGEEAQETGKA